MAFYKLRLEAAEKKLETSLTSGLTGTEAAARRLKFGPNQLQEKTGRGLVGIFWEQFQGFIIWILLGAAVISGFLKEWVDALAIVGIVIVNACLGFIQEYRAEKSLAALKRLSSPSARVVRGGQRGVIPSAELVPGDLIELEAGDHVPADARVIYVSPNFSTQEASLTGESTPVIKTIMALEEKEIPLAERANLLYLGTSIASGKARALVTGTGMRTELGKIAGLIQSIGHEATPLQKKLEEFGRWIVYLCGALVLMVFGLEMLRGGEILDVFLTAVSLAVAAIPEGLPAVITIALALGVQRMVRRGALVRKLPAVETLGCATVICSDKTGTLPRNEMTIKAVRAGGPLFEVTGVGYAPEGEFIGTENPELNKTLIGGVLSSSAQLVLREGAYQILGDPTEGAIVVCALKKGLRREQLENEHPFVEEIPFDSERKRMAVVRREKDRFAVYVKGAPESVLEGCAMDGGERAQILATNTSLAQRAL